MRPLAISCGGFLLGLALTKFFGFHYAALLLLPFLGLLGWWLRRRIFWQLFLSATFFLLALWRWQGAVDLRQVKAASTLAGPARVEGVIATFPEPRESRQSFQLAVRQLGGKSVTRGLRLLVWQPLERKFEIGQTLLLFGNVRTKGSLIEEGRWRKDQIDGEMFLPEAEVKGKVNLSPFLYLAKLVRSSIEKRSELLPSPTSEFLTGLFLGGNFRLPADLREAFLKTGTQHIMAVSGFNTMLLASAVFLLFRRLSRNLAIFLTVLMLAVFILATGGTPSVIRASVMTVIALAGMFLGRPGRSLNGLYLAALLMLLFNPFLLQNDLGFQLSFLSAYAMIVLLPLLLRWLPLPLLGELAWPSLAALVLTWPWISFLLGRVSLVSLPANFLIVPLVPLEMGLGLAALLLGSLPLIGPLVLSAAWGVLRLSLSIVQGWGSLDWALLSWRMPLWAVIVYYLWLFVLLRRRWSRRAS